MKIPTLSTFRFKVAFFIIILLLAATSLSALLTIRTVDREVSDQVMKRAEALSKSIAAVAAYSVLSGDILATNNLCWKVKEVNTDVEYAVLADKKMKILAHTDIPRIGELFKRSLGKPLQQSTDGTRLFHTDSGPAGFEIHSPIMFRGAQIGSVIIGINKSIMLKARNETIRRMIPGLVIVMLLGVGFVIVISSLVTRPINELSKGVDDLKMGRRRNLRVYSNDELGKLTASFNHMTELTTMQQARLGVYAQELEDSYRSTIKVLTAAIDARDPYTLGHSTRVAKLSVKIGEAIGLPRQELDDLEIASLFHDVGKLRTPDYVLLKNGPLEPHEQREITSHCEYGATILSRAPSLQKYIPAVRHHHEWFNGNGYPKGLRGDDIPLHAAIIAVADAFDAMTSVRPYKHSLSREDALVELMRFAGTQFNPWLVDVFRSTLESRPALGPDFLSQNNG